LICLGALVPVRSQVPPQSVAGVQRPFDPFPSVAELLDRYAAGEYAAADLRRLAKPDLTVRALEDLGSSWIARAPSSSARRRLTAATFALDAAHSVVGSISAPLSRRLLAWGCRQLRAAPPNAGTRQWQLASVTLLEWTEDWDVLAGRVGQHVASGQSAVDEEIAQGHLRHALAQFPDEMRFALAAAVVAESRSWGASEERLPDAAGVSGSVTELRAVARTYEELAKTESLRAEAELRLGMLSSRLGNREVALARWRAVEADASDPHLLYLSRLFAGTVLERQGSVAEAIGGYRGALSVVPRAQSATTRLAALLFGQDQRAEAAALADASFTSEPVEDPWRSYRTGDSRLWPSYLAQLRLALR
jgi:hypothetical protein